MGFKALDKYLPMRWRQAVVFRRERARHISLIEAERQGGNDTGKIEKLTYDYSLLAPYLEDKRADHLTRKLRREADRLHVSFPSYPAGSDLDAEDENWRLSDGFHRVLTTAGVARVRKEIREERNARRHRFLAWAPVLTGLVTAIAGLLGVLVALVALGRCGS